MDIILDTNVWVALFNANDAHHEKAKELFFRNKNVFIPEYIILETTTVLQLRASKRIADMFASMVTETEQIEILYSTDIFFDNVLKLFQKPRTQKLSFVDCALLCLAKDYTIHTFDEELQKAIQSGE